MSLRVALLSLLLLFAPAARADVPPTPPSPCGCAQAPAWPPLLPLLAVALLRRRR